jgi:hypothetical protein
MHLTGPWVAACLLILVGGAAFFGWLGADDFGPKDFLSHIGSTVSTAIGVWFALQRVNGNGGQ